MNAERLSYKYSKWRSKSLHHQLVHLVLFATSDSTNLRTLCAGNQTSQQHTLCAQTQTPIFDLISGFLTHNLKVCSVFLAQVTVVFASSCRPEVTFLTLNMAGPTFRSAHSQAGQPLGHGHTRVADASTCSHLHRLRRRAHLQTKPLQCLTGLVVPRNLVSPHCRL